MDKTEHDNLPAVVSGYIDAIIKKMRYRNAVRAEVRQELAGHFSDALADCNAEHERDALAREMIEDFGDAKLLGVLLRRAKKRCRPWWRTAIVRMVQAVGVLFLLLAVYVGWFISGKPVITTNYLEVMNRRVRPVAEDSQNAWPYYKQAAEAYVDLKSEAFDKSPRPVSTLTPEERELLLQWIADNQQSLDLICQGNQKPYYWQAYGHGEERRTELISIQLPHLAEYRRMAYLFCWQAMLKAEAGDLESALEDLFEVYSFGRHLRGQNTPLIEQLVAVAIEAVATQKMRTIPDVHLDNIDIALLNFSRQRFQQNIAEHDFRMDFKGEKLFMFDELQRCFTQTRFGRSHLYLPRLSELGLFGVEPEQAGVPEWFSFLAVLHPIILTHPDREKTREQVEHLFDIIETLTQQTPASCRKQDRDHDRAIEELVLKNVFINILGPAFERVFQLSYRGQTDSFATLTILAVLQYYKMHGDYPDSLAALVEGGLLDALPMDPFSDAPLVYRRTEDGFTLYSVGLNFTDDGGVPATGRDGSPVLWGDDGDAVFWPLSGD